MATVGSLFINVKARTARFSKKMKGVRATVARLSKGIGRVTLKVAKFGAVMGGIAVAAITAMTVAGLKNVDAMAKLAQSVGTSIKSVQVLRHMATLGGIAAEKMDKAIGKMFKNIGEAQMGVGMAKRSLDELGLSAEQFTGLGADEAFKLIADKVSKVDNAYKKARIANDLFGRAGLELIPTMNAGGDAVDAMSKKLKDFGVLIGDKQAQMVEKANDAWADIKVMWEGLSNQLAVEFAPMLAEIALRLQKFIVDAGGMSQIAEHIVKAFMYVGAAVMDVIKGIQIGWLGLKAGVLQFASVAVEVTAWATQKMAELWNAFEGHTLSLFGRIAKGSVQLLQAAGLETGALGNIISGMGSAAQVAGKGVLGKDVKSDLAEFLKDIAGSLENDATKAGQDILDKLAEGWNLGEVDSTFQSLRDKFMGEGFDFKGGKGEIELNSPDLKGAADSLSTAIGTMKVEGDSQARLMERQLRTEEKQLKTSELMLDEMRKGGAVLT